MKLFIDTANINEIKEIHEWGVIDGVTTNPSLVAKEKGISFHERLKDIAELVESPVSGEVLSLDTEGMISEGRALAALNPNIVVKIPMTEFGLKAVSTLSKEGIKTNVTLVFTVSQALLAARSGATYVSPFIGRLEDVGIEGLNLIRDIKEVFNTHNINTEIIAASIRNQLHLEQAALLGADIATVPFKVFKSAVLHPLTEQGIEKFLNDWNKKEHK